MIWALVPYFLPPIVFSLFRKVALVQAVAGLILLAGCAQLTAKKDDLTTKAPTFVPTNHGGDAKLPAGLRRVILMPVAGSDVASPESVAALDPVIVNALQLQNRFEIVPLSREECRRYFQTDEISSVSAIPANFMTVIRREYAADAVLFVDLTIYRAYHPLALGFRAKLATVANSHLAWTFDSVFSADDPTVADSAARYLSKRDQGGLPSDLSTVVLQSPVRFATYAAAAMFATLPPINAPGVTSQGSDRKDRSNAH